MARSSQRGRRNNNPEGRNQYSSSWMDSAWTETMRSGSEEDEFETVDAGGSSGAAIGSTSSRTSRSTGSRSTSTKGSSNRSTRGMSETGGGNASLGAHTGSGAGAGS